MFTTNKEFATDVWPDLFASWQNQTIMSWIATGVEEHNNSPCLIVSQERIKGIIPLEASGVSPVGDARAVKNRLLNLIGQPITFVVIQIDKSNNLFIASREKAMQKQAARTWNSLKEGQVRTVIARRIVRRKKDNGGLVELGVIIELEGIETFLPVQEISPGWVDQIINFVQPGDIFDVYIQEVDPEKQKLLVSVKALTGNPWPSCLDRYTRGAVYAGTVTGVADFGVFVNLEPGVNALCRHPKSGRLSKGDKVALAITRINPEEEKIFGTITRFLRR